MIKMVIFDLDNTLYDYGACNKAAEEILMEEIAEMLLIDMEKASELLKRAKRSVKSRLGNVAASHNRLLYMQNVCEQAGVNPLKYALKFYNTYWDSILDNMKLFPYVRPLIQELRSKNIKIGILTDLTAHIQYRKIERLGLTDMVDYITTSEEAGEEKPSKKAYLRMLNKVDFEPDEVIMIGDSKDKDVEGAKAMGLRAIWFNPGMDILKEVEGNLHEIINSNSLL